MFEKSEPTWKFLLLILVVINIPVHFSEFLSAEFATCLKPSSRDNHRKVSYPRTQQCYQGAG